MKARHLLSTVTALAATAISSSAALTVLDSNSFANKYNGNEIFDGTNGINDWVAEGGATDANLSLNGSNVVVSITNTNGWLQHDNGSTPWESGSGSWTAEASAVVGATGSGGFVIWGALNGERNIMAVRENSVTDLGGTVYDTNSNTDGFHAFRMAYDADEDAYHFFRDGVQLTPAAGIDQQAGTGNTRLIFGDCCTNVAGSTFGGPGSEFEFEYIRYDNSGAFAPVPEPSVASIFGLSAALLCLRRRR